MLSTICRLQSWKWIGAVLAVAAAGAATAAPDITDRLQSLGIPLIGRYPDGQITQSTYARRRQVSRRILKVRCGTSRAN